MNLPTLTVVVPNYNHAHYLPECLESVLQQSVRPLEIIVVDDCSTDNSMAVLEDISRRNPLVSFQRNEKNMGVNLTLNRGLELARGEYVYFFGADDRTLPGFFEKALSLLAKNPQAGLCFPNPASFDHITGKINENNLGLSTCAVYFTPDELVALARRKRVLLHGMSLMKRSAVLEAGGFLPELKWHGDFFTVFVIGFRHGACYLPEPSTLWRALPESYMTAGLRKWGPQQKVIRHILELLYSPAYGDVRSRFRESGVMAFAPRASFTMLASRKYWPFLTWRLLKRAVPMDIFWLLPHWLQRILRRLLAK